LGFDICITLNLLSVICVLCNSAVDEGNLGFRRYINALLLLYAPMLLERNLLSSRACLLRYLFHKTRRQLYFVSVQVTVSDADWSLSGGNLTDSFRLEQFHFHWGSHSKVGSEHTIDLQRYPLEVGE